MCMDTKDLACRIKAFETLKASVSEQWQLDQISKEISSNHFHIASDIDRTHQFERFVFHMEKAINLEPYSPVNLSRITNLIVAAHVKGDWELCEKWGRSYIRHGDLDSTHPHVQMYPLLANCLYTNGDLRSALRLVAMAKRLAIESMVKIDDAWLKFIRVEIDSKGQINLR